MPVTIDFERRHIELIKSLALELFPLRHDGPHGLSHWERVEANGLKLAETTGANTKVVSLFAYLHDACRDDDGADQMHGYRAASWLVKLCNVKLIQVTADELLMLHDAVQLHASGRTTKCPTIGTCWDADRLDLTRVGVAPAKRFLSTDAAKAWVGTV